MGEPGGLVLVVSDAMEGSLVVVAVVVAAVFSTACFVSRSLLFWYDVCMSKRPRSAGRAGDVEAIQSALDCPCCGLLSRSGGRCGMRQTEGGVKSSRMGVGSEVSEGIKDSCLHELRGQRRKRLYVRVQAGCRLACRTESAAVSRSQTSGKQDSQCLSGRSDKGQPSLTARC